MLGMVAEGAIVLKRVDRADLFEKITSEQRLENGKGIRKVLRLVRLRNSEWVGMAGVG